ncbi:ribonuclease P protein component [Haliea sp. E1-2-M8]|uniref:ribonuclease P protein component n=1 Tax=Haliea sp. E1-2-M8 TaxID=3064706 RepID=UPI002727119E|nr:ribonuclease P protein component [Haliea sp. E1-2-M8]MDO8860105.1 ribonuclease P protein component [Haliea sp. E1-2-M8]
MGAIADRDGTSASFGKSRRLLTATQYRAVFDDATVKASHRNLLLLARISETSQSRLGLVIAKKNVRKAVQRNRIKRVARELFRQLPPAEPPLDVVLLARRGLDQLDNTALFAALGEQWQTLHRKAARTQQPRDN